METPHFECPDESSQSIIELLGGYTYRGFYYKEYKYSNCGITIGFFIDGKWLYNCELPIETAFKIPCDRIRITSIVEGSDYTCDVIDLFGEFTEKDYKEVVASIEKEAEIAWHEANEED